MLRVRSSSNGHICAPWCARLAVLIACVAMGSLWLAMKVAQGRRQAEAVARLERAGAVVQYDFQWDVRTHRFDLSATPPGPKWLHPALAMYFFAKPIRVIAVGSHFSDDDLRSVAVLDHLEDLQVPGTSISDRGVAFLAMLRYLKNLNLDRTSVSDLGMATVARIRSLETLSIVRTRVSDEGMSRLAGLPRLSCVDLYGSRVTERGITELKRVNPSVRADLHDAVYEWLEKADAN